MLNNVRAAAVNAQIRAYKDFSMVAMAIIPVVKSFDGKVLNKRFADALNNATLPAGCDFWFAVEKSSRFDIKCHTNNRSYKNAPDRNGYSSTSYIEYSDCYISLDVDDALNDGRINADAIIDVIKEKSAYYKDMAGSLEYGRDNYDSMVDDLQAIANQLIAFNKKYDYCIRETLGLNFDIEHKGSINDYVISTY